MEKREILAVLPFQPSLTCIQVEEEVIGNTGCVTLVSLCTFNTLLVHLYIVYDQFH